MKTQIKFYNNWKLKRSFSNLLHLNSGFMFPFNDRKFIQVGLFGFIVSINYQTKKP